MTPPAGAQRPGSASAATLEPAFDSVLAVPEIRDYQRINAEVVARLDAGQKRIRLAGAAGQRLLLAGLAGDWSALVEIEGDGGPELAAELNAPALTVVARGSTADGAARELRAGRVILVGPTGDALACRQRGGTVLAAAGAGHRAGLGQRGGVLVVLGPLGRLAGERQAGGKLFAAADCLGPHAGYGRKGGELVRCAAGTGSEIGLDPENAAILRGVLAAAAPWVAIVRPGSS